MPLDFSLLGQGPQFGNVLASYEAGKEARKGQDIKGALALYDSNPEQGLKAMVAVDPVTGMKLREDYKAKQVASARQGVISKFSTDPAGAQADAMASGDAEAVKAWEALDKGSRERAHEVADAIGGTAFSVLRAAPGDTPEALQRRREMLGPQAANLAAIGLPEPKVKELIDNPTTAALEAAIAGSQQTLKLRIDDENKVRDDLRADATAEELAAYRKTMAAASSTRAGAAVTNANRPRTTGSTAPPKPKVFAPTDVKWD